MRLINPNISGIYTGQDVEGMVKEYMKSICDTEDGRPYVPNTVLYERQAPPDGLVGKELEAYWVEELRRWRYGKEEMPGMHYAYFHHAFIKKRSGGRIRPGYRRHDMVTFDLMESYLYGASRWFGDRRGRGAIEVGKRGSGKSNRIAMMQVTACTLLDSVDMGFTANSESTMKKYMEDKPKYIWSNLPEQMRGSTERNNLSQIWFGEIVKDSAGNDVRQGRNSTIIGRAPGQNAFESMGMRGCAIDEAPKTMGLRGIFDMTDPCMADDFGFQREGFWWITGVAGDFDKHGNDFIEMWEGSEALNLDRVFIPGWAGMECDEYGNEDVETAVRRILEERAKYPEGSQALYSRIQQFPLTPEECFLDAKEGKMPVAAIRRAQHRLYEMPQMYRVGDIDFTQAEPTFVDDAMGPIELLELPLETARYGIGVDAFGHKMKFSSNNKPGGKGEGSSGGMVVHKATSQLAQSQIEEYHRRLSEGCPPEEQVQLHLKLGNLPVLRMLYKPQNPDDFARRALGILRMYGWKGLVERVPSNIQDFILKNGGESLLFWTPVKNEKVKLTKADYMNFGLKVDEYWAGVRMQELYAYYELYANRVYFTGMLENAKIYDPDVQRKKFDDLDAHSIAFIQMNDPRWSPRVARVNRDVSDQAKVPFVITRSQGGFTRH